MRWLAPILLLSAAACGQQHAAPDAGAARPEPPPPPAPASSDGGTTDASADGAASDGGTGTADPDALPSSVGLAAYFMTTVFAEPRFDSKRIGWIRVGQKFEIGPRLPGDDKCPAGFHALTRSRGFVCEEKGVVVGRYPGTLRHGTQPAKRDTLIPYDYGYVHTENTPLYRRAPSWEQVREIEYPAREEADAGPAPEPSTTDAADTAGTGEVAGATEPGAGSREDESGSGSGTGTGSDEETEEEDEEPDMHGGLVVRYLKKGFILSVDRQLGEWPNLLYRTIRGQWVNARKIHKMRPTTFQGVAIPEGQSLPVAFAGGRPRARYERNARGRIVAHGQVPRDFGVVVSRELDEHRVRYLEAADGALYRAAGMTVVRAIPPPEGVGADEKWIDVDVQHETLVAYQGTKAVFATLISSGSESRGFQTPPGSFRIRSKHVTFTMDGDLEGDGAYSIEDVPYVMYYDLSYALHAAFWHSFFGRQRSHGCVNLSAADARWLFDWVDPQLPDGWYGVWADDEHPGTRVFVRKPSD